MQDSGARIIFPYKERRCFCVLTISELLANGKYILYFDCFDAITNGAHFTKRYVLKLLMTEF